MTEVSELFQREVTAASSLPASRRERRGLRPCPLVFESHGRHHSRRSSLGRSDAVGAVVLAGRGSQ